MSQSSDNTRIDLEQEQVRRYVKAALRFGYRLSVFDGGEITLHKSSDEAAILAAMFTTDEDVLNVYPAVGNKSLGHLYFVYGNDPDEVLNDYTTSLEHVVEVVDGRGAL